MPNHPENQSTENVEDFLPYVFTEDAVSEEDALDSVGQEDPDADGGAGMSALVAALYRKAYKESRSRLSTHVFDKGPSFGASPVSMEGFKAFTDEMAQAVLFNANWRIHLATPLVNARVGG